MFNEQRWIVYDLHMHSEYSEESRTKKMTAAEFVSTITNKGVEVFSITDHNTFNENFYNEIEKEIEGKSNIRCIYGAELKVYVESGSFHAAFYFHNNSNKKDISNALHLLYDKNGKPKLGDIIRQLNDKNLSFIIIPEADKSGGIKEILNKLSPEENIYMRKNAMQHIFRAYDAKHAFNETGANMWALGFYKASIEFEKLVSNLSPEQINELTSNLSIYIKAKSKNEKITQIDKNIKKIGDLILDYGASIPRFIFSDWHNREPYDPHFNNYVYGTFDLPFETLEIATLDPVSRIDILPFDKRKDTHLSFIKQVSFSVKNIDYKINFSSGLNAIIGKRASGKSFLMAILLYLKGIDDELIKYAKTIPINFDSIKCVTYGGNVLTKGHLSSVDYVTQSQIRDIFENPDKALEEIRQNFLSLPRIDYSNFTLLCECMSKLKPYDTNYKSFSSFVRLSKQFTAYSIAKCVVPDFTKVTDELSDLVDAYSKFDKIIKNIGFGGQHLEIVQNKMLEVSNIYLIIQEKYSSLYEFVNNEINKNNKVVDAQQKSIKQTKNEAKEAYEVIKSNLSILLEYKKSELLLNNLKLEIPQIKINRKRNCLFVSNYNMPEDIKNIVLNALLDNVCKHNIQVRDSFEFVKDYLLGKIKLKSGKTSLSQSLSMKTFEDYLKPSQTFYQLLDNGFDISKIKNTKDLNDATNSGILENISESSIGRKSIFYLELLLNLESTILLLDQPEDNIDNDYISSVFVPLIKKEKKNKQLIFVSHNPSVAVYADAFNYIYATNDDNLSYSNYFIEKFEDKISILNILDGGEKSFANRNQKYGNVIGEFKYAQH